MLLSCGTDCCCVITLWSDGEMRRSQLLFPGSMTLKGDCLMVLTFQLYLSIMHIWRESIRCMCVCGCMWRWVHECFIWYDVGKSLTECVSAICVPQCVCQYSYCLIQCLYVCVCVRAHAKTSTTTHVVTASWVVQHYPNDHEWLRRQRAQWRCECVSPLTCGCVNTVTLLRCRSKDDCCWLKSQCFKSWISAKETDFHQDLQSSKRWLNVNAELLHEGK